MQPFLIVLRNPKVLKFMLGMLLVVADMIAKDLGTKRRGS